MRKVPVENLTVENFSGFGSFANLINPQSFKIGATPIEFYRDMVMLNLGQHTQAALSVCRVSKREPVVDVTEAHTSCGEGILPLDGDILIHVGPATPNGETPTDRFRIFRVPKGTMVTIRPGVWHHAPFTDGTEYVNVLIILPERTYANDCKVVEIPAENRVTIEK